MSRTTSMGKTPVYSISHGGPNIMEDTHHPVFPRLTSLGDEIINKVQPKAIVAISAHWESSTPGAIEINSAEKTDLIYDFYGFPKHYYQHKFPTTGSTALAAQISNLLTQANIPSKHVTRGLDHGIFASFTVLFPPSSSNSIFPSIPLVQISLPSPSNSPISYFALGQALEPLRSQGILIICSGMAVHNLRDMFSASRSDSPRDYTISFDEALKAAVVGDSEGREERMSELLKRTDAKRAHPSWEHLWPVYVAAGAAGMDEGERIWGMCEGSLSWSMFRFGEVGK